MIKADEENGLFTLYTKHTAMILKVAVMVLSAWFIMGKKSNLQI